MQRLLHLFIYFSIVLTNSSVISYIYAYELYDFEHSILDETYDKKFNSIPLQQKTRSARQLPGANNAIVGQLHSCDVSPIMAQLCSLKRLIADFDCSGTCSVDLLGVFTHLNALGMDITSVFTVLNDIEVSCTALVDLSGVYSELQSLEVDINSIFTVLNDLGISCTAEVDLSGIYTQLQSIETDIASVFTVLNDLNVCCTVNVDFSGIFTELQSIQNNIQNITNSLAELELLLGFSVNLDVQASMDSVVSTLNEMSTGLQGNLSDTLTVLDSTLTNVGAIGNDVGVVCTVLSCVHNDIRLITTALDDLSSQVHADLGGIFTALSDLHASATVEVDLTGIYTVLDGLEIPEAVDLSGVFTVLDDLNLSVTVDIDLSGVFTCLQSVDNQVQMILDSVTDLETNLSTSLISQIDDLRGIYTVLDDLNLSVTVDVDLNSVFTCLQSVDSQIQTVLDAVVDLEANLSTSLISQIHDLRGIYTVLDDLEIPEAVDLSGVFTVLDDLNLSVTVDIDLSGIFTCLQSVDSQIQTVLDAVVDLGANLSTSIITQVHTDLTGIYTVLNGLEIPETVDLSGIFTVLNSTLSRVGTVITDIDVLDVTLDSIDQLVVRVGNGNTSILSTDLSTSCFMITSSGHYILGADFSFSTTVLGRSAIKITASNVLLDMNGHKVLGNQGGILIDTNVANVKICDGVIAGGVSSGITIGSGCHNIQLCDLTIEDNGSNGVVVQSNCYDISIKSGVVTRTTGTGIVINTSCKDIALEDLLIKECLVGGIVGDGSAIGEGIVRLSISGCSIVSCTGAQGGIAQGVYMNYCDSFIIESCKTLNNDAGSNAQGYGFRITNCDGGTITNCIANGNGGLTQGIGFYIDTANNIVLKNCQSIAHIARSSDSLSFAGGFYLNNANRIVCDECQAINNVSTLSQGVGFYCKTGSSNILNKCIAQGNQGSNACSGFLFEAQTSSAIQECISQANRTSVSGTAYAIRLKGASNATCYIGKNFLINTQGFTSSRGIVDEKATSNSLFVGNYAFNNGTNYAITYPTLISLPIVTASLSNTLVGLPSLQAGLLDNVSAAP